MIRDVSAETFSRYKKLKKPLQTYGRADLVHIPSSDENQLVFTKKSGDHCRPSKRRGPYGILGTKGRRCDKSKDNNGQGGPGSCDHLCRKCGYKVVERTEIIREKCNCAFNWCCSISCETCTKKVLVHYCK